MLKIIDDEKLVEGAKTKGEALGKMLDELCASIPDVCEMARGELVRLLHPLLARERNGRFPGHAGDVVKAGRGHFVVPSRIVSGAVLSADAA